GAAPGAPACRVRSCAPARCRAPGRGRFRGRSQGDSRIRTMGVTHVAYEADGWGVGELWLDEAGRVVWHELPWPSKTAPTGSNGLVELLQGYFAGEDTSFD